MIRVLVVDDSAYMRYVLRNGLEAALDIQVVDTAKDGIDALAKIAELKPDVVTLDLEMPRMDGFETLQRIMSDAPLPVIMLSSLTQDGADATIRSLRLGAIDFVSKPATGSLDLRSVLQDLQCKVKQAAGLNAAKLGILRRTPTVLRGKTQAAGRSSESRGIVVIGSSAGGPRALHEVVPQLPESLSVGVLLVQHMPPGFTRSLAQRLDEISALKVKEAERGDVVQPGLALVAPGNYHLTVTDSGVVELDQRPQEHGVRPAIDKTMEAAVQAYGSATLGVILTGMGCDGTRGAHLIKQAGGKVIAEDESTCIIYGMPRAAVEAGVVDKTVPLDRMANEIAVMVQGNRLARPATA